MTGGRLAVWILGAAVCGAWLASAAGVTQQARVARSTPRQPEAEQFDALAADIQAQAGRLRDRLAQAPAPREEARNPFRFQPRSAPAVPRRTTVPAALPEPLPEPLLLVPEVREPALQLIGVAESGGKEGAVRTAMIAEGSDLLMVKAGEQIRGRYEVVAVGADAVELKDVRTGAIRRLLLR